MHSKALLSLQELSGCGQRRFFRQIKPNRLNKIAHDSRSRVFFPGLNGLRFFAAFAVILTHLELLKDQQHLKNLWDHPFFFYAGGLGVYFFFVLSGFLITYLLLKERESTGTISIKDFYLRRIFRIWPLYYALVLLAFFVFPQFDFIKIPWLEKHFETDFWLKFFFYCIMLPNLAMAMYPAIPHAGQTWSIGVEEQFYLIWPVLMRFSRNIMRMLVVFTILIIGLKGVVWVMAKQWPDLSWMPALKKFVAMIKFESMSIGAIGAWLLYTGSTFWLRLAWHRLTQLISYAGIFLLMFFTPESLQDFNHLVYSGFFLIIILNVCSNPNSFFKLTHPLIDYLGKISYGIYMIHMVVVVFFVQVFKYLYPDWDGTGWGINLAYYSVSIVVSLGLSALSYEFFEKRFIRMKDKFSKVVSGDAARV